MDNLLLTFPNWGYIIYLKGSQYGDKEVKNNMYSTLKKIRIDNKLTLLQMSELLGYNSPNAYSRKEKGERKFTIDEARTISLFFKLPIEDIFFNHKVPIKGILQEAI